MVEVYDSYLSSAKPLCGRYVAGDSLYDECLCHIYQTTNKTFRGNQGDMLKSTWLNVIQQIVLYVNVRNLMGVSWCKTKQKGPQLVKVKCWCDEIAIKMSVSWWLFCIFGLFREKEDFALLQPLSFDHNREQRDNKDWNKIDSTSFKKGTVYSCHGQAEVE